MDNNNIIDLYNHLSKLEKLFSKKEILSMYQKGLIYEDIISTKNANFLNPLHLNY